MKKMTVALEVSVVLTLWYWGGVGGNPHVRNRSTQFRMSSILFSLDVLNQKGLIIFEIACVYNSSNFSDSSYDLPEFENEQPLPDRTCRTDYT